MSGLLLSARLGLAGMFLVSAAMKLRDAAGFRGALASFGAPAEVVKPLAICVVAAEAAVGVALVSASTSSFALAAAFALLAVFTAALVIAVARGRRPACRCFGQLSAKPTGWRTVARNGLLLAVVGGTFWLQRIDSAPSIVDIGGPMSTVAAFGLGAAAVMTAFIAGVTWLLVQILAQQGRLLHRLDAIDARLGVSAAPNSGRTNATTAHGLAVGARAPAFDVADLNGGRVNLDSLLARRRPLLLVFVDPGCAACDALSPAIAQSEQTLGEAVTVAIVSRGSIESNRAKADTLHVVRWLLESDYEVGEAYAVTSTPSAVLIRPDGTIGSPLAVGNQEIGRLLTHLERATHAVRERRDSAHNALGMSAALPSMDVSDLAGRRVRLPDLVAAPTVLLFWNPSCGFCNRMLPDLRSWETTAADADAVRLVVISTGSIEANRALGLSSRIVLQSGFEVAAAFGATGTPSAVLIDGDRRIASPVVVGAVEVLKLLAARGQSTAIGAET